MSALLAQAQATFTFQGANVHLQCSSPEELLGALAKFGFASNEGNVSTPAAATAPAGKSASPTAAPSVQRAEAKAAGEAGNVSASTSSQASVPPAAGGSQEAKPQQTSGGEQGNANAGAHPGAGSAPSASADKSAESSPVTFEELKKAFLALSTKAGGREKCEGVLKPFGLAKLSAASEAQYPALLAEIKKASA